MDLLPWCIPLADATEERSVGRWRSVFDRRGNQRRNERRRNHKPMEAKPQKARNERMKGQWRYGKIIETFKQTYFHIKCNSSIFSEQNNFEI